MEGASDLLAAIGRFHPFIVHFPIGLIAGVACLELWMAFGVAQLRPAAGVLLGLAGMTAIFAVICGLLLAWPGGYDETLLTRHRLLGLGAAALVAVSVPAHRWMTRSGSARARACYRWILASSLLVSLGAGYYGGIMAHGEGTIGALAGSIRRLVWREAPEANAVMVHADDPFQLVAPILESRCYECHGAEKQKSGLRLDSRPAAMAGGESGLPVIVPGNAMKSELVEVITLPAGNKRAMPPTGKPRLEAAQVMAVIDWINRGASWPDKSDRRPAGLTPPSTTVLEQLRADGFLVSQLAVGHPLVRVDRVPPGTRLSALAPIAPHIAWLSLAGFRFEPGEAEALTSMPHLSRLELQHSNVQDTDMVQVAQLPHLRFLNLYATSVGDPGLDHLQNLDSLARLYLWQTQVTPEGLERVRAALPNAEVDSGSSRVDSPASADATSPAVF